MLTATPWPNPAPSHADRNHSLVASTDRPLFGLLTTELKSRLKDWENLIGNFKTDRQRFIQRMERKWGPVSMWSEAIYSVCARKENSLDGVSEVLLKEMASLAEAGMKWSHFRDNNTPRVNVTTGDVQKLTGGVTKRTLQALVQAIKAGSRSGNASSENIPDRSTDEPLPTETMVEHAAVDGSLDPGLLGLPEVAAHAEPDELAEWEPDESTVISSTDRPRSVSILRERPDGKLKGEPRLNEAIWRDFFHPIRGFRPQSRYWSTGDTQRPIETSYVFRKTGEERAPYDKVWVNRISPVSPNDCVVSIWQLKILFLELARPFPRLPSCVEVQSGTSPPHNGSVVSWLMIPYYKIQVTSTHTSSSTMSTDDTSSQKRKTRKVGGCRPGTNFGIGSKDKSRTVTNTRCDTVNGLECWVNLQRILLRRVWSPSTTTGRWIRRASASYRSMSNSLVAGTVLMRWTKREPLGASSLFLRTRRTTQRSG